MASWGSWFINYFIEHNYPSPCSSICSGSCAMQSHGHSGISWSKCLSCDQPTEAYNCSPQAELLCSHVPLRLRFQLWYCRHHTITAQNKLYRCKCVKLLTTSFLTNYYLFPQFCPIGLCFNMHFNCWHFNILQKRIFCKNALYNPWQKSCRLSIL